MTLDEKFLLKNEWIKQTHMLTDQYQHSTPIWFGLVLLVFTLSQQK
jgi:hypothetical protein